MGWLAHQARLLLCAVQFLTRIPTPALNRFESDWITRAARYFPLVGQGVGAISAGVFFVGFQMWGAGVAAVLAIGAGLLVTGAFHEDGLADTADGLGGGQTAQRRLEIMKDSRIGTYGVCALLVALGLKAAVLATLTAQAGGLVLLAAHGAGRAAAVVAMRVTPYAPSGEAGKWKPTPIGVRTGEVIVALVIAAWPLLLLPAPAAGLGLALGGVAAVILARTAVRLIGGHTGDVLGAVEQVFEVGFLLGVAALA
ncbi:adenosylcobinamide-GDP ribazoletransferase [Caulobacter segnis]|uniref:Adenosylcobinamide-GDP ribazoletransferase n=2 Tax=Caulobacter segnis TaxID=88688 RepID=D5VGM8_CAUST|nr:adenosylcobinamide-GDP ribazoletransferase [Caulobacter segnis]ADG10471.1 cobalamin 5'-phosphate synthase [Caulobacter segnis ATCC 21756]AVQ02199.1 adenosylcobinamide-GDP ribazoletransferase [Caulobacter segnis]